MNDRERGERGSGISVATAQHDDDDDNTTHVQVLEVSPTAKCSPGISTEPGINCHGRVHYRQQVVYHNTNKGWYAIKQRNQTKLYTWIMFKKTKD